MESFQMLKPMQDSEMYVKASEVENIVSIIRPYQDYHALVKALPRYFKLEDGKSQAEQLLTKVCEYVKDIDSGGNNSGGNIFFLSDIPGLKEWWVDHKPKSEREEKLEKVQSIIKTWWPNGMDSSRARIAERVLQALGL